MILQTCPYDQVGVTHSQTDPLMALSFPVPTSWHLCPTGPWSQVPCSLGPDIFTLIIAWTISPGPCLGTQLSPNPSRIGWMLLATRGHLRKEDGNQGLWPPFQTPYHWWVGSIITCSYYIYLDLNSPEWGDMTNIFVCSGDSGVGKSSLLVRFADNHFSGNYITTIGNTIFCLW